VKSPHIDTIDAFTARRYESAHSLAILLLAFWSVAIVCHIVYLFVWLFMPLQLTIQQQSLPNLTHRQAAVRGRTD